MKVALEGYSPVFRRFELSFDNEPWIPLDGFEASVLAMPGPHLIRARLVSTAGFAGPAAEVQFRVLAPREFPPAGSQGLSAPFPLL
jgi:hypothetical protein